MSERFNVVVFDPDGYWHEVGRALGALSAVVLSRVMVGEAERDLSIAEVLIVDSDDYTNFLWRRGQGIVYPPPEELQKAKEEESGNTQVSGGGE